MIRFKIPAVEKRGIRNQAQITFRVDEEYKDRIKMIARLSGMSVRAFCLAAMEYYAVQLERGEVSPVKRDGKDGHLVELRDT